LYFLKEAVFHSPLAIISAVTSVTSFLTVVENSGPFLTLYDEDLLHKKSVTKW
jgi:hypothetical protein